MGIFMGYVSLPEGILYFFEIFNKIFEVSCLGGGWWNCVDSKLWRAEIWVFPKTVPGLQNDESGGWKVCFWFTFKLFNLHSFSERPHPKEPNKQKQNTHKN